MQREEIARHFYDPRDLWKALVHFVIRDSIFHTIIKPMLAHANASYVQTIGAKKSIAFRIVLLQSHDDIC